MNSVENSSSSNSSTNNKKVRDSIRRRRLIVDEHDAAKILSSPSLSSSESNSNPERIPLSSLESDLISIRPRRPVMEQQKSEYQEF